MRYVQVPADITVTPTRDRALLGEAPYVMTFARFAESAWLDDPAATAAGFTAQVRWAKVAAAVQSAHAGEVLPLEDQDYATLKKIAEAPKASIRPLVAVQLLAFTQAVLDATTTAPRPAPLGPEAA